MKCHYETNCMTKYGCFLIHYKQKINKKVLNKKFLTPFLKSETFSRVPPWLLISHCQLTPYRPAIYRQLFLIQRASFPKKKADPTVNGFYTWFLILPSENGGIGLNGLILKQNKKQKVKVKCSFLSCIILCSCGGWCKVK